MTHQVLVEVTNKKLANHFRRSDSICHAEAHIPVGRSEKGIPRNINLELTRRHHPVTGTPSLRVEGLKKGTCSRAKITRGRHNKGDEPGLRPFLVMDLSSSRQGALLSLAPPQHPDDRASRPSSSSRLRRRIIVHNRNVDNYCLSGVLIHEMQVSVPRSAQTEPKKDLSHGNRRRHSWLNNQVCKNNLQVAVGKSLTPKHGHEKMCAPAESPSMRAPRSP